MLVPVLQMGAPLGIVAVPLTRSTPTMDVPLAVAEEKVIGCHVPLPSLIEHDPEINPQPLLV